MTSAAKPKRRPPFTTLATRLMLTSFSANSLSSRSRCCPSPSRLRRSPWVRAVRTSSEFEAALAGGVGQGLDPAMIEIGAAVEYDALDPRRLGALGDQLADRGCRFPVGTGLQVRLDAGIEGRGRGQCPPGGIVDDLGIDMPRRAEHRQPYSAVGRLLQMVAHPLAPAPEESIGVVRHVSLSLAYFFFPSLRRMVSSAYLIPLPL